MLMYGDARRRRLASTVVALTAIGSFLGGVLVGGPVPTVRAQSAPVAPVPDALEVTLTATGFTPEQITVGVGQSIVITNSTDATRTITSGDGTFDSGPVAPSSRYVLAFPQAGSWTATDDATPNAHTATITVGQLGLIGDEFTLASTAIPDVLPADAAVLLHPELGLEVTRNRILVAFADATTVPQANAALAAAGLTIVGGNRDLRLLVTEVADAGTTDLGYMQAALDLMRVQPGVRAAAYDTSLNPETVIPRPVDPDPGAAAGTGPFRWEYQFFTDESIRGSGANGGLEASRFPQGWNWLDRIRETKPSNAPASSTVVLDSGFDTSHPDIAHATLHELCTVDGRHCSRNRTGVRSDGTPRTAHGTGTAGIIGAAYDRGPTTSTTSQGTVGGDPLSPLHLVPYFTDNARDSTGTVGLGSFLGVLDLILDNKEGKRTPVAADSFRRTRVINLSAGFFFALDRNERPLFELRYGSDLCGPGADDDATTPENEKVACTPDTKDSYLTEFRQAAQLMRPLADRLAADNILLVVAAGNDSDDFCADRPRPDPTAACANWDPIDTANSDPFGYLASIWTPGVPPWLLVEASVANVNFIRRMPFSNVGGTITAPGAAVMPLVDAGGVPTWYLDFGTSMAAPYVSAAAGLLSGLTPSWQSVRSLLVDRAVVDVEDSTTPRLDVFSSLLGLPPDRGIDALLDVNDTSQDGNRRVTRDDRGQPTGEDTGMGGQTTEWSAPDGRIDMRDFRRFRDAYLDFCPGFDGCPDAAGISLDGSPSHPKKDFNLDGCIVGVHPACENGEGIYSRLDFNGDATMLDVEFPILIDADGAPTARGAGSRMTDLDVFRTRFGEGPNADTEGWTASDLDDLLVSADVELRLDQLWAGGAETAEVTVATVDGVGPRRTFEPRGPGDVRMYTLPVDPVPDLANNDLIQVRVVGTLVGGESTYQYLSPPLDVKAGQDIVVVPCASQLIVGASELEVGAGGSTVVYAQLNDCLGRPVPDVGIDFTIPEGSSPSGSTLSVAEAFTDATGTAYTSFTYPPGVNGSAQVVATAYAALDGGEPLQNHVDLGPADDVVVHYRFRQTILDYQRTSTNDWGAGEDDCDGTTDAGSSPAKCFTATQYIAPDRSGPVTYYCDPGLAGCYWALGDVDVDRGVLERVGTITPNGRGGATVDEQVASRQNPTEDIAPDAPIDGFSGIEVVTEVEEWDPATPDERVTKYYESPIEVAGQPSPYEFADLPAIDLDQLGIAVGDDELTVEGLRDYADFYAVAHQVATFQPGFLILPPETNPDLPLPNLYQPLQQVPTDLALVPREDLSSLMWDDNPAAPLSFTVDEDGGYESVSWCGVRERLFDNTATPGFWNDTDPAIETTDPVDPSVIHNGPYRDPDEQRAARAPGDRAAPRHTGSVTSRFEFVAVVTRAGDPEPSLVFPSCEESDPTSVVGWNPDEPVEGQRVDFVAVTPYSSGAESVQWRFGDPSGLISGDSQFRFSDNGTYTVDYTITDADGQDHASEPADVVVRNAPPTLEVLEFTDGGRSMRVRVDDPGVIDRQQLEVRLTSPTPGWPAGGITTYTSPPFDPLTGEHSLDPWEQTIHLPDNLTAGAYFVVLSVLDKDGGKANASFSLAVNPPPSDDVPQPLMTGAFGLRAPRPAAARAASTPLAAAAALVEQTPLPTVPSDPVPAMVVDRVSASTGDAIDVRNATRTGGVPTAASIEPGDERGALTIAADATVDVAYSESGTPTLAIAGDDGARAAVTLAISGDSVPADVTYQGATSAPLGVGAAVSASTTRSNGTPLPGTVVRFTLGTASIVAVSGADGVASAELPVTGPTGVRELEFVALPDGVTSTVVFTVTPNAIPVVDAGGDYTVGVGSPLDLVATASDADPGESATLGVQWDLDDDGEFDDASGTEPALSADAVAATICGGTCDPGEVNTIAVRAVDVKGGRGVDTATVTSISDFALTIDPPSALLVENATVSFTVGVVSENGFDEPVTLSAPNLPAGITAQFSPATVTPDGTALLHVRASSSFVQQTFALDVRGTSGDIVRTAGTDVELEFGLYPECFGEVSGRVTDKVTGEGIEGVRMFNVQTDADGHYRDDRVSLGTGNAPVTASFSNFGTEFHPVSPPATVEVACGIARTLDVELLRRQFGAVSGVVTGVAVDGTPLGPIEGARYALNAFTGPDGRYELSALPLGPDNEPSQLGIAVSAPGFHTRSQSVTISADTTSTLDFTLLEVCSASIRVRVLDERTGKIVAGARVDLGSGTQGATTTDDHGVAIIDGIDLGAPDNRPVLRTVRARTPDGVEPLGTTSKTVALGSCGARVPVDIAVPYPNRVEATVDVRVVDDVGAPVDGAIVRIGSTTYSGDPTDADGRVTLTHLLGIDVPPTLTTTVNAFGAGLVSPLPLPVTLRSGVPNEVTITLVHRKFGTVEGIVRDRATGVPIEGVGVNGDETGPDGRYRVEGISLNGINEPAGYTVSAFDFRTPPIYWSSAAASVTVRADEVTQVPDLLMTRICAPATVRGRVVHAVTREPLEEVVVRVASRSVETDADGRFVIDDIPIGQDNRNAQYTVRASKAGFVDATKQITVSCDADIVVDFGSAGDGVGTITGRVVDADDNPVAQADVVTGFGGAARTGFDGRYTIADAPAGPGGADRDWSVSVTAPPGAQLAPATSTATVRAGATTTVDFVLDSLADDPPTAASYAITIEPVPTPITLGGVDPTGDPLTFAVTTPPVNGTLSGSAPNLVYSPDAGFSGIDSIEFTVSDGEHISAPGVVTITVRGSNQAPNAVISGDLQAVEGGRANLSGTGSTDADGTITGYAWELDGDGLFDDDDRSESFVRLPDDGTVDVALRVTDDRGATGSATQRVTFVNVAPTIEDGETSVSGATLEIYADIDEPGDDEISGTIDVGDGSGPRDFTDDELGSDWFYVEHNYGADGTYPVVIVVCDDQQACSSWETTASIGGSGNVAPVARVTGPDEAVEGDTITLSAMTSTDADGEIVAVAWDLDGDDEYDSDAIVTTLTRPDDAEVEVRLAVLDDDGAIGYASSVVTFVNGDPVVAPLAPLTVTAGFPLAVDGSFADPGTDEWTATVDWDEGGGPTTLELTGTTFGLAHVFALAGTYDVVVEVCDDDDGCGATTLAVTVEAGNLPPDAVVVATPDSVVEGTAATVDGTSSTDADGTITAWAWDLDADGQFDDAATPTAAVTCLDDGARPVTLRVTDDDGASSTGTTTVTCTNLAPVLDPIAGAALDPNATFSRTGGFTDPGTDTWTATVDWGTGDGDQPLLLAGTTFALSHPYATPGSYVVTVRVCDDDGGCASTTATVTVAEPPPDAQADLSIAKHHDGDLTAGNTGTYTIDVVNAGPDVAQGVTVTDTLPAGLSFTESTSSGWACSAPTAGSVVCTFVGGLPVGSAPPLVIGVSAATDTAASIVNTASVTATTADPDETDNLATDATNVVQPPPLRSDLYGSLTMSTASPMAGDTMTWTVTVGNHGPDASGEVRVEVVVPDGVTFGGLAGPQGLRRRQAPATWTCSTIDVVVCTLPDLAPGTTSPLVLRLTVGDDAAGTLVGSVTISGPHADADESDNVIPVSLVVQQVPPSSTTTTTTSTTTTTTTTTTTSVATPGTATTVATVPTVVTPNSPVDPTSAATTSISPSGVLPTTGSDDAGAVQIAMLLLGGGGTLLLLARRQRRRAGPAGRP